VAFYLNKYHICVRSGNHCAKILKDEIRVANTLRISLYFYNTKEEIDKFISLISDKAKIEKEML
jgi:cysteine desulfurase/selenocysteine lyase